MRVLQLCHKIPFPPIDGGSIAMHQITEGLQQQGYSVKVFALKLNGCTVCPENIPAEYRQKTSFEFYEIDQRVNPIKAFLNLFTRQSYNVSRFFSKAIEQRIEDILKQERFDIIQLEGLYLTPYIGIIRKNSQAPLLYRSHNIEHFIWERMAFAAKNPLKAWYLRLLAARLKMFELRVISNIDGIVAISPIDLAFFRKNGINIPAVVIPVTIPNTGQPEHPPQIKISSVFHLGSMDWRPNQDGIEWFLDKVWPLVIKRAPQMRFFLAGKGMPPRFGRYASENVVIAGQVHCSREFMADKQIMVVPLLSGSGMRVKIIEGMAAAKTIVSTTIGAEGIDGENGHHIFIADDPEKMAEIIVTCHQNPELSKTIAENAKKLAQEKFNPKEVMPMLSSFYRSFYGG